MILNVLLWYLIVALAGWLVFPLAYRLLSFLPDRGLAVARPLGLLVWGYAFWLLASAHILQNDAGGVAFGLLIVAGLSAWSLWRRGWRDGVSEILSWIREHKRLVITSEALFLVAFIVMAVIRAANPDAAGTEKPMELMFIDSILRSPGFPPADGWLSGYAISYYYFGYVMVAMLARITGTPGSVAFNLALATWYALTALAAYGLLYNLLSLNDMRRRLSNAFAALVAPLFVLVVSNLEGFLEVLHAGGVGSPAFWQWLNVQELVQPAAAPFTWQPSRPGGIWWWRASRVLQDFDFNGQPREIIDEFPAFSYVLGDLHPHVLAMPFGILAASLALNFYLRLRDSRSRLSLFGWLRDAHFWLAAVVLGGLAFLNTWDFPIYVALFAAAAVLAHYMNGGWKWELIYDFLEAGLSLGIAGAVLYLPFYLGFSSQANGILPSLVFFTRGTYFWLMFGSLLFPIVVWLAWKWWADGRHSLGNLAQGLLYAAIGVLGLWALSSLYGDFRLSRDSGLAGIYGIPQGISAVSVVLESIRQRIESPGTWLSLLALLGMVWGLFMTLRCGAHPAADETDAEEPQEVLAPQDNHVRSLAEPFVLLMLLLGLGLVLFPEFFYLRDQFGWRMNTIFKFYFQAWIMWSIAAGYASIVLLRALSRSAKGIVFDVAWVVIFGMAFIYPFFAFPSVTNKFHPDQWTLNGAAYMERYSPDEMAAIDWLKTAPYGVVAEAVGGSYTSFARVSTFSGEPTVLGWPGHESQWRGGAKEMGTRETDIAQLYKARLWDQASAVISKYSIRYVYMGSLERSTYKASDLLFERYLTPVFHNGSVTIYEVPQPEGQAVP